MPRIKTPTASPLFSADVRIELHEDDCIEIETIAPLIEPIAVHLRAAGIACNVNMDVVTSPSAHSICFIEISFKVGMETATEVVRAALDAQGLEWFEPYEANEFREMVIPKFSIFR